MTMYQQFMTGLNLSGALAQIDAMFEAVRGLERGTVAPTIHPTGMVWNRTDEPTLGDAWKRWNGSTWTLLLDPEFAQVNAGGTVAFAADQDFGGHKATGLAAATANGDGTRYEQTLILDAGGVYWDGRSKELKSLAAPTASSSAARLADVQADGEEIGFFTPLAPLSLSLADANYVPLGFTPREGKLRIYGDVKDGGTTLGTVDLGGPGDAAGPLSFNRWDAEGPFAGDSDVQVLRTLTFGANHVDVKVKFRYTAPLGLWIWLERQSNGHFCTVDVLQVRAGFERGM